MVEKAKINQNLGQKTHDFFIPNSMDEVVS